MEHYLELYCSENTVSEKALDSIPALPVLDELDIVSTIMELEKDIDALANAKPPGKDAIPPGGYQSGKTALLPHLHELLCQCWKEGS